MSVVLVVAVAHLRATFRLGAALMEEVVSLVWEAAAFQEWEAAFPEWAEAEEAFSEAQEDSIIWTAATPWEVG